MATSDAGSGNQSHPDSWSITTFQGQLLRSVAKLEGGQKLDVVVRRDLSETIQRNGWDGSLGTLYQNLQKLEEFGLVATRKNPKNAREKTIELTDAGRDAIRSKTHQWEIAAEAVRESEWERNGDTDGDTDGHGGGF